MSIKDSRLDICIKSIFLTTISCLIPFLALSDSSMDAQQDADVAPSADDLCKPVFSVNHLSISCLESVRVDELPMPNVYSECGHIVELNYIDEYYELGCHVDGFKGWFQKDNWIQSKIKGDGGVDVTGAPNALLVEGANKALVEVMPGGTTSLTVVVPADGFITFDWSIVGGSNLSLTVRAGESVTVPDRYFVSQSLKAGDTFSLLFQSTFKGQKGSIELTNFRFLSKVKTLIQRKWTAVDQQGNEGSASQFIGIKGILANQILMPMDVKNAKSAYRNETPTPELTGFPVFDRDGDWATTDDQIELQGKNCSVDISWKDEVSCNEKNEIIISRKWTIEQGCGQNTIIHTQEIVLQDEASEEIQPARKGIGSMDKKKGPEDHRPRKNYYSYFSDETFDAHE